MIADTVRRFIRSNFYLSDRDVLGEDDSLLQSGIVDSTGVSEIVGFLQTEFDIHIARSEVTAANLDSIRRITAFVSRKIAAAQGTTA